MVREQKCCEVPWYNLTNLTSGGSCEFSMVSRSNVNTAQNASSIAFSFFGAINYYHYHYYLCAVVYITITLLGFVVHFAGWNREFGACMLSWFVRLFFFPVLIFLMPSKVVVILTQFIFLAIHVNMFWALLGHLNPCLVVWARTTLSQV